MVRATGIPGCLRCAPHGAGRGSHARLVRSASAHQGADLDEATEQSFSPLDGANRVVHQRLKLAFDPSGVLNPGRMYAGL